MQNSLPSPAARARAASTPIEQVGPRILLHTPEFAADPHTAYQNMRNNKYRSSLVPVELAPDVPATLAIGFRTAARILNDPEHFPADSRAWQDTIPADSPVRPMLEWRPNALRSAGLAHALYRGANTAGLDGVDPHRLRDQVIATTTPLINKFCRAGKADLIADYARPLAFSVMNTMLGCTDDVGNEVAWALARMFDSTTDTDKVNQVLIQALGGHIADKRANPGDDVTTRLLTHKSGLSDEELINQLVTLYAAGIEPMVNLIANTVLLMVTEARFLTSRTSFGTPIKDALTEILVKDPPITNLCLSYPPQPIVVDGIWLPANQPVVISMAACNNDPTVNNTDQFFEAEWHLSWGAGPHACFPSARVLACMISHTAIERLLDALPDLVPAIPKEQLVWRPGPFHRALQAFPVVFNPAPPLHI
ncbi:cytochrome P450 [Nocardia sp. NPDC052112]|uniref:cytochrome P450 n=1 Tax=Nocardia sp. NPDC052112 TaxID=3155646 RepID=UPI00342ED9E9